MKHSLKKYLLLAFVIGCLVFLGFYRDFFFKTMNSILQSRDYEAQYTIPASLKFLDAFDYNTLVLFKWLFTVGFSCIYLGVALLAIKAIFDKKKYSHITIGLYIFITLISGIFIFTGYLATGIGDKMYEFARYLMGMAQSPIVLMILIPAFKLSEKENKNI